MSMGAELDLWVLVLYMAGVVAWGAWLGRGNRGGADYFLGGRNLPWWAVMLSVVATETSTLTLLSVPGVAYLGTLAFLQLALGYLAGRAVVGSVTPARLPMPVGSRRAAGRAAAVGVVTPARFPMPVGSRRVRRGGRRSWAR